MARKTKESPLNLIQILPPKNGQSPSKPYSLASTHFKLQIDAEEPTGLMLFLTRIMAGAVYLFRSIGSVIRSGFDQGQRAIRFANRIIKVFMTQFAIFLQKIARWTIVLFASLVRLSKKLSPWIHMTGKHVWMKWTKTKQRSRALKIELRNVHTIEQRDELLQEVHALRDQLSAQQDELVQVTTQMGELKALVLSQQQVLLHLGKELEAAEKKAPPLERLTSRKTKSKASKTKKPESSEMPSQPALSTDAPH